MCHDYSYMQILTQECMFLGHISMNFIGLLVHCLQMHRIAHLPTLQKRHANLYVYQQGMRGLFPCSLTRIGFMI